VRGSPPEIRLATRQARARLVMNDLRSWFDRTLETLSTKSEMAKAIRYALARWTALTRYLDDGEAEIGRVEMWRGGVGLAYLYPALSVAGASLS
jgi:hypothetical protein